MTIDLSHFTPWTSLAGGVALGAAVALFLLLQGRVLGISGIVGGLLRPRRGDAGWRIAFLLGMLVAPTVWALFAPPTAFRMAAGPVLLVAGGLLVGWGTRHGSGCTSGHGVCGLARLSPRSLLATAAFMATGFLAVYVLRHVIA
jgi:uncharacterized membrane protein YedE/YeeE